MVKEEDVMKTAAMNAGLALAIVAAINGPALHVAEEKGSTGIHHHRGLP